MRLPSKLLVHVAIAVFTVAGFAGFARSARAQAPDSAADRARVEREQRERVALIQMKSDLRKLVTAQEAYYADHQSYASTIDLLHFRPSDDVASALTVTQNNGWAGESRSTRLPNVVCSVYINVAEQHRSKRKNASTAAEGEPVCDVIATKQQ